MMKRYMALLLALTLLLCGCVGYAGNNSGNYLPNMPGNAQGNLHPGQTGNGTATDIFKYAVLLRVTINPEFLLYLDSDQNILRAEAINEDAKVLFADLDVTGQRYADGMTAVLNAAYDRGYLKDGGEVTIEFDITDSKVMEPADVSVPVKEFRQEKAMEVELSTGLYVEEIPENQNTVIVDGQTLYIHRLPLLQDGSGEAVGVQINYFTVEVPKNVTGYNDERWNAMVKSVWLYDDGRVGTSYWENGEIQSDILIFPDGLMHWFVADMDGFIEIYPPGYVKTIYADDGSTTVLTFDDSGEMKTTDITWPNGDYEKQTYNENGNISDVVRQYEGIYSELYYDENGQFQSIYTRIADGTEYRDTYENGVRVESHTINPDGTEYVTTFDENGNPTNNTVDYPDGDTQTQENDDGSTTVSSHYSNGQIKTSNRTWPNGDYENQTYYENGNISSQVAQREGTYSELYYDENSQLQSTYTRMADGTENSDVYENGIRVSSVAKYPNGDVMNWSFYEDGMSAASMIGQIGGSYIEQYWDEVGNLIKMIWYDEDGNRHEE